MSPALEIDHVPTAAHAGTAPEDFVVPAFTLAVAALAAVPSAPASAATLANVPHYSLPLALQESLYFYDAQKSGPARTDADQPLSWRGDSDPTDACVPLQPMSSNVGVNLSGVVHRGEQVRTRPGRHTGCLNLSGGYHDAGDHVKFGLPQTYAASVLGWGMYEFPQAYTATGTWNHALDEMKWFSDYFLRSTFLNSSGQVVAFAYQVGEGSVDHDYWGPSELQSATTYPRPAYLATPQTPAADRPPARRRRSRSSPCSPRRAIPRYSAKCLKYAQALYTFAVANPGHRATRAGSTTPAATWTRRPGPRSGCTSRPAPASYLNDIVVHQLRRHLHRILRATSCTNTDRPGRTPGS